MIKVQCGACKKKLSVPDHYSGKRAVCPSCKSPIQIPGGNPAPMVAPPPTAEEISNIDGDIGQAMQSGQVDLPPDVPDPSPSTSAVSSAQNIFSSPSTMPPRKSAPADLPPESVATPSQPQAGSMGEKLSKAFASKKSAMKSMANSTAVPTYSFLNIIILIMYAVGAVGILSGFLIILLAGRSSSIGGIASGAVAGLLTIGASVLFLAFAQIMCCIRDMARNSFKTLIAIREK